VCERTVHGDIARRQRSFANYRVTALLLIETFTLTSSSGFATNTDTANRT